MRNLEGLPKWQPIYSPCWRLIFCVHRLNLDLVAHLLVLLELLLVGAAGVETIFWVTKFKKRMTKINFNHSNLIIPLELLLADGLFRWPELNEGSLAEVHGLVGTAARRSLCLLLASC